MNIVIQGRDTHGNNHMVTYYTKYATIYDISLKYTGRQNREKTKFEYDLSFRIKSIDYIHFDTITFRVYITKHEYVKAIISLANQHIVNCLHGESIRSLFIDTYTFEADDTVLEGILAIMDEQEKANIAKTEAKIKEEEEALAKELAEGVQDGNQQS